MPNYQFSQIYSKYYDLLYEDKPYKSEVEFIKHSLAQSGLNNYSALLDLGCGTGKHLNYISKYFDKCTGIDISAGMINRAKKSKNNLNIDYKVADISDFSLGKKFSCIISLFHVFSYLTKKNQIDGFFNNAYSHSQDESILMFDYYNYDGLMSDKPSSREKIVENDEIHVARKSFPVLNEIENTLKIRFEIKITDKLSNKEHDISEDHFMRFFKQSEIEEYAERNGFQLIEHKRWMKDGPVSKDDWYACSIFKKRQ